MCCKYNTPEVARKLTVCVRMTMHLNSVCVESGSDSTSERISQYAAALLFLHNNPLNPLPTHCRYIPFSSTYLAILGLTIFFHPSPEDGFEADRTSCRTCEDENPCSFTPISMSFIWSARKNSLAVRGIPRSSRVPVADGGDWDEVEEDG